MRHFFTLLFIAWTLPWVAHAQPLAVTANSITIHHIGPFVGQLAESNAEALRGADAGRRARGVDDR